MTAIFSQGSMMMAGRGDDSLSNVFTKQQSSYTGGNAAAGVATSGGQSLTAVGSVKVEHSVLTSTIVSTPAGSILVVAGGQGVSAVALSQQASKAGVSTWSIDEDTLATCTIPDVGCCIDAARLPTTSNSAFVVVGTVSGAAISLTVTKEVKCRITVLKTETVFADSSVSHCAVLCDENARIQYVSLVGSSGFEIRHAKNLEPAESFSQVGIISFLPTPRLAPNHPFYDRLSRFAIVTEDALILQFSSTLTSQTAFHESEDFTAVSPMKLQKVSHLQLFAEGEGDERVTNAAELLISEERVTLIAAGCGWWGYSILCSRDPREQGPLRVPHNTLSKFSMVKALSEDQLIFADLGDVWTGSCRATGPGGAFKSLVKRDSYPLPINTISAAHGEVNPCFMIGCNDQILLFLA